MEQITPTQEILARWPSRSAICQDLGVKPYDVAHWHSRSSIPARHFGGLVESARRRKIRLSLRELVDAKSNPTCQNGKGIDENQDVQKHTQRSGQ